MTTKTTSRSNQPDLFHNTIALEGEELKEAILACERQDDQVLIIMQAIGSGTPTDVLNKFPGSILKTSVRRALTDLVKLGHLRKTNIRVPGPYGKKEHLWEVRTQR